MYYSIGEVANVTGLNISTLRYYDKEGLFPSINRGNGGIRIFTDIEINTIKMIECLKATGMPIKDIKQFFDWCQEGDATLQQRLDMFKERYEVVIKQMEDLQKTMDTIKFKFWYYSMAVDVGSEEVVKNIPLDEMPEEIKLYMKNITNEKT